MKATEALRLIVARAPSISHEAAKTLQVKSVSQQRVSLVVMNALRDPEAAWTQEERAELVEFINPEPDENYSVSFLLRLTPTQHAIAKEGAAVETGGNVAEWMRRRLFVP